MPDKTLKVVTYAAGASLAAITLIYVFGPTYFLDTDPSSSSGGSFSNRKQGVVGLANPANDCFINSVLQVLAGLGDLRLYLIRETHRRSLDDDSVYAKPVPPGALGGDGSRAVLLRFSKDIPDWKLEGLQRGNVTRGLKEILDALNERPIHKKTISALPFVRALEQAFRQRISRQQQDAQEFLQVVAERLCDEYHAGRAARLFARRLAAVDGRGSLPAGTTTPLDDDDAAGSRSSPAATRSGPLAHDQAEAAERRTGNGAGQEKDAEQEDEEEEEEGFPLEGKFESQIECLTCGFNPRPTTSTFCTLTLNVPQAPSTTLEACLDGMFKTEYIEDFKCEKCRLVHAAAFFESEKQRSASEGERARAQAAVEKLRLAIETDPEKPPEDVALPDSRYAPKRKIARHIRMTEFPNVLAVHLSRSIFDASRASLKNSAKVAFPEELRLGGLLQQQRYKLLGVVTHKGSHHSGHYESFRRQSMFSPYSNPSTFQASGVYSRTASPASTPRSRPEIRPLEGGAGSSRDESAARSPYPPMTPARSSQNSLSFGIGDEGSPASSDLAPRVQDEGAGMVSQEATIRVAAASASHKIASPPLLLGALKSVPAAADQRSPARSIRGAKARERKQQSRWWRISDDKVKEANTRDVLGMQREVYLLFYELDRPRP